MQAKINLFRETLLAQYIAEGEPYPEKMVQRQMDGLFNRGYYADSAFTKTCKILGNPREFLSQEITTPNGVYKVFGVPSEALLKKLSRPYRKPPVRKPNYDYPIEEAEKHGVVFPTRERQRKNNLLRCSWFNAHFQALSGTTLNCMQYNDIEDPSIVKSFNLYNHEEERDKLLKRHGVLLTGLSRWERNNAAEKILLTYLQTTEVEA